MRATTVGTIAAVWLSVMFLMGFDLAGKPLPLLEGYVEGEMRIVGGCPKIGETFEVVYRMKISVTADWTRRESSLTEDYVAVIRCFPPRAAEIVGQDSFFFSGITIGETKEFRTHCRILRPVSYVFISGDLDRVVQGESYGPLATGGDIYLLLVDPATGQYGTREEWLQKATNVFWKYENIGHQWLSKPDQEWEAGNRRIAEEVKKFEPALSDSEALCLDRDNYLLIINAIGDPDATDSSRVVHLLDAGWLEAQRAGAGEHDRWLNDFMRKNKGRWGGDPDSNFFRDSSSDSSNSSRGHDYSLEEPTTTFVGRWLYQDHLYNKEQGLLRAYETKPVKTAEVGILAYWSGQINVYVGWGTTDIHGNFFIQTNLIPSDATQVRASPMLFAWGPEYFHEKVKVTKPGAQAWPNPRDPTVWRLSRSDSPPAEVLVPGGDCDFGVCYPETATTNRVQPKSGAVNILESYLAAREVVPTAPVSPLTAVWEPGYDCSTGYSDRTIEVRGNLADTDEWDDDVLLHEFGHYLMHEFAQIPSGYDPGHKWHLSDTAYPNTAYIEGWADFFSGAARIGSAADSLYVDNESIGSSTLTLWVNLEDPWIGSEYNPSDFQGGPWCEGAIGRCSLGHLRCPRRDSLSILS